MEKPALDGILADKGDLSNNYGVWITLLGYKKKPFPISTCCLGKPSEAKLFETKNHKEGCIIKHTIS